MLVSVLATPIQFGGFAVLLAIPIAAALAIVIDVVVRAARIRRTEETEAALLLAGFPVFVGETSLAW